MLELVVVMAIVMSIAGALAHAVQPARAVFDRVPAELDLHQRGRTSIEVLSQAVRSAGRDVAATQALGPLPQILPAVSLADPDASGDWFATLTVIAPAVEGAQGVLGVDQPGASAPLTLAASPCPDTDDVCGFMPGMSAVVADGSGRYDVFVVAAADPASGALTPNRGFGEAYRAGAAVIEIDQYTFSLASQADGSHSLIRRTAAGAIQPMVDFVTALAFRRSADQVEIVVTVQAPAAALRSVLGDRVFRTSIRMRNGS